MSEDKPESSLSLALGWGLVSGVAMGLGIGVGVTSSLAGSNHRAMQRKAVEVGAAVWVVNPMDGKKEFKWREPK